MTQCTVHQGTPEGEIVGTITYTDWFRNERNIFCASHQMPCDGDNIVAQVHGQEIIVPPATTMTINYTTIRAEYVAITQEGAAIPTVSVLLKLNTNLKRNTLTLVHE